MPGSSAALALTAKLTTLRDIFRPGAPTVAQDLFRGRARQLSGVIGTIQEVGFHVVVHGERGVGKTSLTHVATQRYRDSAPTACVLVRLQAHEGDGFTSVWRRFARDFDEAVAALDAELSANLVDLRERVVAMLDSGTDLDPDEVARALRLIASRVSTIIVIDEFDRAGNGVDRVNFADLVKNLSDSVAQLTIVFVGVADDVEELIVGHKSLSRNLREVRMPRMTDEELRSIVVDGYAAYSERTGTTLDVEPSAATLIAALSEGFPFYTHLLAGQAGARAIESDELVVTRYTVLDSMLDAVDDASQSIGRSYETAVLARSGARLDETLLAASMAQQDQFGWFAASALQPPFATIFGAPRATGQYGHHLRRFSEGADPILQVRRTSKRTVRYRFRDPLMRPYVLMRGIQSGMYRLSAPDGDTAESAAEANSTAEDDSAAGPAV